MTGRERVFTEIPITFKVDEDLLLWTQQHCDDMAINRSRLMRKLLEKYRAQMEGK